MRKREIKIEKIKKGMALLGICTLTLGIFGCGSGTMENPSEVTENITDQSTYFPAHSVAKTQKGYYMWDVGGTHLLFFDKDSKKQVLLCDKPDCEHNIVSDIEVETSEECNSYFSSEYVMNKIWAYGDSVYVLQKLNGKGLYLTQVSGDGNGRKPLICLSENLSDDVDLILHQGMVYFSRYGENEGEKRLYRAELKESASIEQIDEIQGEVPLISHIKGYGNDIWYVTFHCEGADEGSILDTKMYYQLKKYDTTTQETVAVSEENIDHYALDEEGQVLYYHVCGGNIFKMNLATQEVSEIYQDDTLLLAKISYDGTNLYVDNFQSYISGVADKRVVVCLDENGTLKKQLSLIGDDTISSIECGDENFLFELGSMFWSYMTKDSDDTTWVKTGLFRAE